MSCEGHDHTTAGVRRDWVAVLLCMACMTKKSMKTGEGSYWEMFAIRSTEIMIENYVHRLAL